MQRNLQNLQLVSLKASFEFIMKVLIGRLLVKILNWMEIQKIKRWMQSWTFLKSHGCIPCCIFSI